MPARAIVAAALAAGLLGAPTPPAVAQDIRPIEGHENWKLGMTLEEAMAAEPRAERHECADATCLHYADRRFPTAEVAVSARIDATDTLDVIVITMNVKPGDNRCQRVYAQLAAFYTAAHGEILPVSRDAWVWSQPQAMLSLLSQCDKVEQETINILFEALTPHDG